MIRTRAMLRKYQGAQLSVSGGTDISAEVDRFALRETNRGFEGQYVKIESPGFAGAERQPEVEKIFYPGAVVSRAEGDAEARKRAEDRKRLEDEGQNDLAALIQDPQRTAVKGATGAPQYYTLTLLPSIV